MSTTAVHVIRARTIGDLITFLHRNPSATGIRIETGLRFWGGYTHTLRGLPDPTLDGERESLAEAIRDHPSLEVLVFRGPSRATFLDVAYLLKGAKDHMSFRSIMIPVVAPENYEDTRVRAVHYRMFLQALYQSRTMTNLIITNGTNHPGDGAYARGGLVDTQETTRLQKMVDRVLQTIRIKRNRDSRI